MRKIGTVGRRRRTRMTIPLMQSTIVTLLLLQIVLGAVVDARRVQDTRIINGVDAPRGRYPWITLYLFNSENTQCGGSLIAPDVVVTAAHCVEETNPDLGYVSIGKYNISDLAEGNPIIKVAARYPNPNYTTKADGSYDPNNDIALLKLVQPAINPQLIRMNNNASYPSSSSDKLVMLGWGSTTNGDTAPLQTAKVLQQATTEYVPFETCAVAQTPDGSIKYGLSVDNTGVGPDWLCTDDPVANHCVGDSGGPIIRLGDTAEEDLLVGVISGSSGGCDNPYLPQINQRISYHYNWIRETGCNISEAPIAEWGCGGSNASTSKPTEEPTPKPSVPPLVFPTLTPTAAAISTSAPTSLDNGAVPTLAPSTVTILQPTTERGDNSTLSPVLVTISTPTAEPTVSAMMGDNSSMPTISPVPSEAPTSSEVTLYIKISFDDAPQEIGWYIADANYSRFRVAVPAGAYVQSTKVVNDQVSVMGGASYEFVISDSAGNGLSRGGSYQVSLGEEFANQVLASGSGNFGTNQTTRFFVPGNSARVAPSEAPTAPSPAPTQVRNPTRAPTSGRLPPTRAPSTNLESTNTNTQSSGSFCHVFILSVVLAIAVFVDTIRHI